MPMLSADVPEELIKQLDEVAAEQSKKFDMSISRSALVRKALREYLSRFFLTARLSDETISQVEETKAAA
jgi:metal-responsive CopG/Arc/MetJ family transcriptional regulator